MRARSLVAALIPLAFAAVAAAALSPVNKSLFGGVAIEGYDPVAYFVDGRAVKGSKKWEHEWSGAVWRFASEDHRVLFAAAPEKYAPQYGGYCAWAVGHGYTAGIDPEAWSIRDGKLYLNYDLEIREKWLADPAQWIGRGDANWPNLLAED